MSHNFKSYESSDLYSRFNSKRHAKQVAVSQAAGQSLVIEPKVIAPVGRRTHNTVTRMLNEMDEQRLVGMLFPEPAVMPEYFADLLPETARA
jgi:hypothetical protein